jgi:hypothetical protein
MRLMNESRCDERLKERVQEVTCLTYTGLHDMSVDPSFSVLFK